MSHKLAPQRTRHPRGGTSYPWPRMAVGDAAVFPCGPDGHLKLQRHLLILIRNWKRMSGETQRSYRTSRTGTDIVVTRFV